MKILYHHRIASKDGQYVHIAEIINALREQGHEVIVVEPDSINSKEFGESSSFVKNIRALLPGFVHELAEFIYSVGDYFKLKKAITQHSPDFIYERYNLYLPSGVWAAKKYDLPLILEVNAPLYDERSEHDHISLPGLARWTEEYVWRNADKVLPVTQVLANRVAASGVDQDKLQVIHNGINQKKFSVPVDVRSTMSKLGLSGKKVMGFTGFVRDWHRLDRVLDVMHSQSLDGWCFLVVGDGPARKGLEERARELGLEKDVIFTGLVERDSIIDYVSCFDIALQPDVVDYASPLKLFEYLVLGKAVLAPNKPNIREILSDQQNALLFDVNDGDDFKSKLCHLCESSSLRQELGSAAETLVEDRGYYWSANAEKIVGFGAKLHAQKDVSTISAGE